MSILKNKKVVLWGVSNTDESVTSFFKNYLLLLEDLNIEILFAVDNYNYNYNLQNIKVIAQSDGIDYIKKNKDINIIITARFKDLSSAFKKVVGILINQFDLSPSHIYHPSIILPLVKADFQGKAINIGFPGSGNTIVSKILEKLMTQSNYKSNINLGKQEKFIESIAYEYEKIINDFISDELLKNNTSKLFSMNNKFESVSYKGIIRDRSNDKSSYYFAMFNILYQHMLFQDGYITPCYIFPTIPIKNIFTPLSIKGYKFFTPIRNPMDVIISNAFKLEEYIISSFDESLIQSGKSEFRDKFGNFRLYNYKWFKDMAISIKLHYEELLSLKSKTYLVKYENILNNPQNEINNIGQKLDINISNEMISKIWNDIGYKSLNPTTPTNYNNPSNNKHLKLFTSKHSEILKEIGFEDLLKKFDYSTEINFNNSTPKLTNNTTIKKIVYLHDNFQNFLYGKPISFNYDYVNILETENFKIFSDNKSIIEKIKLFTRSNYTKAILNK